MNYLNGAGPLLGCVALILLWFCVMIVQGRVKPLFAWYDLWVGAYYDRKAHKLYILPLPTLGVVIDLES